MTDEQIKQNAEEYILKEYSKVLALTKCAIAGIFAAGAHSRDEEVNNWKESYEELAEIADELQTERQTLMIENAKLLNPWRDSKKELPPIDESDERVSIVVIAKWFVDYDCYIHEAAVYSYEHKRWESTIGKYKTQPEYWMPIPELPKGCEK